VPILVRPHPDHAGRYQVVFGHRRLAAVMAFIAALHAFVLKTVVSTARIHAWN